MKRLLFLIFAIPLLSVSCGSRATKRPDTVSQPEKSVTKQETGPRWFYLSENGIYQVESPATIPARTFRPWTEAVRITDAAIIQGMPVFLINHLGIMAGGGAGSAPALYRDSLFSKITSGGIYRTETGAVIRLYHNSIFTEEPAQSGDQVCLASWNPRSGTVSACLTSADFGLLPHAQLVALDRIGSRWYASFKTETKSRIEFAYLEFEDFPDSQEIGKSKIRRISQDQYIKSVAPFNYREAPEQIRSLLEVIPETTGLNIRMYSRSTRASQDYQRSGEGTPVEASAYVSDDRTAVLFSDGTFYYRPDNTTQKRVILRLPPLSQGYVYTSFIISGKSLLAAWEEQRFYETGRAGLLETPLPDDVY